MNNIRLSYIAGFLKNLQFFSPVIVPYFLEWLNVDYTRMFLLQAWYVLWIFLLEIPTGIVADKYGRKISVALGVLVFGIDLLMFGLIKNYWLLFAAEFFGALGSALISGADTALIYDSVKKDAKVYLSRYEAAGTLGMLIAVPFGSVIAGSSLYPFSLALTFLLSGAFCILSVFFYLFMKEPNIKHIVENPVTMGINSLKHLFRHKRLRTFAANSVLISACTFFIYWYYQPLAGNAGIGITYYGFIAAGFNLIAVLFLSKVKLLETIFGMRRILFFTAFIPGLSFIILSLTNNLSIVLFAIILIAALSMLRKPILADYMNQYIASENRATINSSISLFQRLFGFTLYLLLGFLSDMSVYYAVFFLGVLILLFTFVTKLEEVE